MEVDGATFVLLSLNAAFITSATLGNDVGVLRPDVADLVSFTLGGLGAAVDPDWIARVEARLVLPERTDATG